MITGALFFTFNAVPIPTINNTHTASPLTQSINANILRRVLRRKPLRILSGNRIPNTDRIMHAQLSSVALMAWVQAFQGLEGMAHESVNPFSKRGSTGQEGRDGLAELATGKVMAECDIQRE
jgi:hypothetical protein